MTICVCCGALVTDRHPAAFLCPAHTRAVPRPLIEDYRAKANELLAFRQANRRADPPRKLVCRVARAWVRAREAARAATRGAA